MEWRLFDEGTIPFYTTRAFFDAHPWVPPEHQQGHEERTAMAETAVRTLLAAHPSEITSLVDLGCGDGDLLRRLQDLPIIMAGYTSGIANVERAHSLGLPVALRDFIINSIDHQDLVLLTEVLEHMVDPGGTLQRVDADFLIITSPSAETDEWHYEHHAWAWDLEGYRVLCESAGWTILNQTECEAQGTTHCGMFRPQRFQAITAKR